MSHEVKQAKFWINKVHGDRMSNLYQVLESLRDIEEYLQERRIAVEEDLRRQQRESMNRLRGL